MLVFIWYDHAVWIKLLIKHDFLRGGDKNKCANENVKNWTEWPSLGPIICTHIYEKGIYLALRVLRTSEFIGPI